MSAPPRPTRGLLFSRVQATTCLWLAPGPSCTPLCLMSGVPQFSQGEKPVCLGPYGSRELSQCPVLALVRQALIGDPSLLSFNVLIPAFGWESFHKLQFLVPISLCS